MPLFLFGKSASDSVYEFHSTPFNNEHLKYSRLLSFHMDNKEYKVGDFVLIRDDVHNIFQIKSLAYKKNNNMHPDLVFTASVFTKASLFYAEHKRLKKRGLITSKEYIKFEETTIHKPRYIVQAVSITQYDEHDPTNDLSYYCKFSYQNGQLKSYIPMQVRFCDPFIEKGIYLCCCYLEMFQIWKCF